MAIEGVDFANERPSGANLKAAGKHFVMRYLSPNTKGNPGKLLEPSEITSYRKAGLDIGLLWETTTSRAKDGKAAGVGDAERAEAMRTLLGIPKVPIYFVAQDEGGILGNQVMAYFAGVASVIGLARTGAYGGRAIIKYLFDHKAITYGFQTYAWSAGLWDPRAQLQQYHNGVRVAGVNVDLTRAMRAEWGQWKAAAAPVPPVVEEDELSDAQVQQILAAIEGIGAAVSHSAQFDPDKSGKYTESLSAVVDKLEDFEAGQISDLKMLSEKLDALPAAVATAVMSAISGAPQAGGPTPKVDPIDVAQAFETDVLPNLQITLVKPS